MAGDGGIFVAVCKIQRCLLVRGLAVALSCFGGEPGDILDAKGFFDTGDVATVDEAELRQLLAPRIAKW